MKGENRIGRHYDFKILIVTSKLKEQDGRTLVRHNNLQLAEMSSFLGSLGLDLANRMSDAAIAACLRNKLLK